MTKAVISNRIYLNCTEGSVLEARLVKALTYSIDQMPISEYPLIIKNVTRVTPTVVSIPSGRVDLIPEDYEIVDKRTVVPVVLPKENFTLRPSQQEAVDLLDDNGLANAPVGFGKTLIGLGVAARLQQKTLIITTTTTIRDMWIGEIKKFFGFNPGVVGGGKMDISPPIVVGNIQTVRNRLQELSDKFGIIIVDEVHRSPAKTFTEALNTFKARYKIGLSGTLERKDQLHVVLQDYFGFKKFVGKVENTMTPSVHLYDTGIELSANEFIPWANKITEIMNNPVYRNQLLELSKHYVSIGHKVLVLCDRTEMLEYLHLQMPDNSFIITGKVNNTDTRNSIMKAVAEYPSGVALFATQSIFSEGVSLNELSTVILGSPINNEPLLIQIAGRVLRMAEGKLEPIIVDLGFRGNTGKKQQLERKRVYINKGWPIKDKSAHT